MSSDSIVSGWREPAGRRDVGKVTSTVSSTSIRSSCCDLELGLPGGQRLVDRSPGLAHALAGLLAGLRRQRADLAVGERQRRAVAGVVDAHLLELGQVGGPRDGRKGLVAHLLDLVSPQGRDLDGVVGRVGAGHAPQSRKG